MKIDNENNFKNLVEIFIYSIWCIITFGVVYVFRVIITQAIKKALVNTQYEKVVVLNKEREITKR